MADIDFANLAMLKELLADRFNELIETYLSDSEARVAGTRTALRDCDLVAVSHEIHGLKGSSRNIGATDLSDLCEVMEQQARDKVLQDGQQQLAAIEQKFAVVTKILRAQI